MKIAMYQDLVSTSGKNIGKSKQNNLRSPKHKWGDKDERDQETQLEKIYIQATKVVVERVKTTAEKT